MKKILYAILCCCASLSCGCTPSNPYGTVSVTGKVTVDGAPLEGVTVSFVPPGDGMSAFGITDADGNYMLTTAGAPYGTGAVPGSYSATFSKTETAPVMTLAEYESLVASGNAPRQPPKPPEPTYLIPQKFSDPKTAGFDPVEVKKGERNKFDFNLETK